MRFEEHDNQLFRMLEEPVPLTPDAEMPCLVRLIQDDSPMGMYNRDAAYFDVIGKLFVAQKIKENPFYSNTLHAYEKNSLNQDYCIASIHTLEIIGYPVVEGSHWWALYSAMNGKSFVHKDAKQCRIFTMFSERELRVSDGEGETVEYVEIDEFLNDAAKDGWQLYKEPKPEPKERPLRNLILRAKEQGMNIRTWYQDLIFTPESLTSYLNNGKYRWWNIGDWELTKREANMPMPEPEPLLADAKVGDLCRRRDGKWVQIDRLLSIGGMPWICYEIGGLRYINNGEQLNSKLSELGIISTEPLAPEGTAEWAWQMMLLGEKICHKKSPSIMYCKHASEIMRQVRYNCVDYMSASAWLNGADKNGWQLYKEPEQKPSPSFETGDWVEYRLDGDTYYGKLCDIRGYVHYLSLTTEEIPKDQARAIMLESIIRKLKPSEIVVRIGCLSGTVRPVSTNGIHIWFHLIGVDDKTIAIIRISSLDTETRELVEGLLKAQR